MAWFGEGFSSLRGQISNFAKGVLVDDEDNSDASCKGSRLENPQRAATSQADVESFGWNEAEEATFIGQDVDNGKANLDTVPAQTNPADPPASFSNANGEKDVAAIIQKGVTQLFHNIGGAVLPSDSKRSGKTDQQVQTEFSTSDSAPPYYELTLQQLREENSQMSSEVTLLRRTVRELETQIASTQDENSNLSTGLEALDIQHQEAIQSILVIKEETQKELEQVREQLRVRDEEYSCLLENNERIKRELELANLELMGCDTLSQENAHLRARIAELVQNDLPAISEQSAAEDHIRTLETEVAALKESRDNLERETITLMSQIQQREVTLRQVDARIEAITKEKEVNERNMTQIVFECNSLREELKATTEKAAKLQDALNLSNSENASLKEKLETILHEMDTLKNQVEVSRRETSLAKDEVETLKTELESLKEELGGEEAKTQRDLKHLEELEHQLANTITDLKDQKEQLRLTEKELDSARNENKLMKSSYEKECQQLIEELNELRDTARDYSVQKDIFKEKEVELKRQLVSSENDLLVTRSQLSVATTEICDLKVQLKDIQEDHRCLNSKFESLAEVSRELVKYKQINKDLTAENENLLGEIKKQCNEINTLETEIQKLKEEYTQDKPMLDLMQNEIDNYKKVIKLFNDKLSSYEEGYSNNISGNEINVTDIISNTKRFSTEKTTLTEQISALMEYLGSLTNEKSEINMLLDQKQKSTENKSNEVILNEVPLSSDAQSSCSDKKLEEYYEELQKLSDKNKSLEEDLVVHAAKFETYGGITGALHKLEQLSVLQMQIEHFKNELSEAFEEKNKLFEQNSKLISEKEEIVEQVGLLRKELDSVVLLKEEIGNIKHLLQMKTAEAASFENETKRLNNALSVQLNNNELLYREKNELLQRLQKTQFEMQSKMSSLEEIEKSKTKQIDMLKQEVENMKTQLEYASQLLQDVERQEGEGQPSGESHSQKMTSEVQEEMTRLSAALLKEQTECKLLRNQLEESKEKLDKAENQLRTLKSHLVEIQDSYSSELSAAEEKLRESQAQLISAEERARNSATAYTSASIRANQQVETLREQLRLVSEQKEKLEHQVSMAEDAAHKQSAAVTRLQAVLHQFHIDKQKDIDFETERIRRDLQTSEKKNEQLLCDIKKLEEQLHEAQTGLALRQKLSDEFLKQSDFINELKNEIFDLKEKLRMKEEKMSDLNSDSKVDRTLVKNLLVGYVTSPADSKGKVLGVLGQVLSLSKEERQKVGLEPGGRQQTLSEAFIKFLEVESQPRAEVILPLPVPSGPPSRKSSLLAPEVPVLPHFPVGRSPGSILKDVLQERRPQ